MKEPKERLIYSNYDLWDAYSDEAERWLIEEQEANPESIAEDDIWNEIYNQDEIAWEILRNEMSDFFDKSDAMWLAVGSVGRWNGNFAGGFVFTTFDELVSKAGKDCDYFKFTDVNGRLYMHCSHHDGSNEVEVKRITEAGKRLYDNWNYSSSTRYAYPERIMHKKLFENYSTLPNYLHKMYGCPLREYIEVK